MTMRIRHRLIAVFACTTALAAFASAPAQADDVVYVGYVGKYQTWMDPSTCTSGGHYCDGFQIRAARGCASGGLSRSGYYDDVFVRFDATEPWHC
jgi:hypothetical protein